MGRTKGHKKVHINGTLDKNVRFGMSKSLWAELEKVAEAEGREQGRPKSVSAVMRKALQAHVDARGK